MIRRSSRAPGRGRPERRRSVPLVAASFVMVAALIAACGGGPTGTPTPAPPTDPVSPTATAIPATPSDAASPTMTPIEDPEATDPPPTDDPTSPVASAEPDPTDPTGASAEACTGTSENRDFYAAVADAVAWTVYCPMLPAGWFVDAGQYRLAGGGWMEIAYRGPGGARIELREGAFCTGDDCTPDGSDLGEAAFGDRSGSFLDLGGGRYAIVVGAGASVSWVMVASGLSEAAVRSVGSAMVVVSGS